MIKKDYFNFLKFHLISYYVNFIKLYNSTCNYNSNTATEMLYKYLIKNFYSYINERCNFKIQLLKHSNKHFKMTVLTDIENYINSFFTFDAGQNNIISVTEIIAVCNLNNLY